MTIKVSIVIRCYNEEQHIGRLLSGLMQQIEKNFEIIVVDSGSTDATVSIAFRYPVKVLSIKPENFSFGSSLNLGCQAARGDFIVIVSAHTYPVYQDWLERLLEPFGNPQVALVYGKQRGNEITQYSEHQVFAKWFPEQSNFNQHHPFCNNANAAIRRTLWEQIPYNEALTGLEDLDWAKRVMQQGYSIAYSAEAEIIHVHEETSRGIYNRYRREAIAFKAIFPEEKFNFGDFFRLSITNIISDYYHAWQDRVLIKNLLSITLFRLMQFWGTYQGFRQHGLVTKQLRQTFYYPRQLSSPKKNQTLNNVACAEKRKSIDYNRLTEEVLLDKIH